MATRWRLWGAGSVAEFFHRRGRAGADGEGAAVEQRRDGGPASGVGIGRPCNGKCGGVRRSVQVGIGTRYNARDYGGAEPMSGGTQKSVRPPRQGPPSPRPSNFPRGVATRWRLWVRAAWQNFSIGVGGQVRTVRERRSNRDAMAAPRAAWESVGRATENAAAFGGRCRWESVRDTTLATTEEQSRCQVGPKNLFDRPARDPHPLVHQIFPVGWPGVGANGLHELIHFHNDYA